MNSWYYNRLNDNEIESTDSRLAKYVYQQPWFEWTQENNMKLEAESGYTPLEDINYYVVYTMMLPEQETYWLLKWGPTSMKDHY
jgi:hypothetical protein